MTNNTLLIVFAKAPEPGKVKTRLMQGMSAEQAAAIYTRLLTHTLTQAIGSGFDVAVWRAGDEHHVFWQQWPQLCYYRQAEGDLGEKMAVAIQQGLKTHEQVLIIGSDCYAMDAAYLQQAGQLMLQCDVLIGPADDGGYVLMGVKHMHAPLFKDIRWSTDQVLPQTEAVIKALNLQPSYLPTLNDIDTPDDAIKAGLLSCG